MRRGILTVGWHGEVALHDRRDGEGIGRRAAQNLARGAKGGRAVQGERQRLLVPHVRQRLERAGRIIGRPSTDQKWLEVDDGDAEEVTAERGCAGGRRRERERIAKLTIGGWSETKVGRCARGFVIDAAVVE